MLIVGSENGNVEEKLSDKSDRVEFWITKYGSCFVDKKLAILSVVSYEYVIASPHSASLYIPVQFPRASRSPGWIHRFQLES